MTLVTLFNLLERMATTPLPVNETGYKFFIHFMLDFYNKSAAECLSSSESSASFLIADDVFPGNHNLGNMPAHYKAGMISVNCVARR